MENVVVETARGRLRGERDDGVVTFRGIRYGATTEGAGRFTAPGPVEPWSGIRDAVDWAPAFPQPELGMPIELVGNSIRIEPTSEDALVVNVWTPALDAPTRPVMVWLHGGGFTTGSGSYPLYDGASLARRDDVVVVTVNHRLGVFGYLHLGELAGAEYADSGVAGMLDIVAALRWVRDNIAAFGGDAGNVTIFGESGGGAKVNALLAMPAASGLFHRAVCQSGVIPRGIPVESATRTAAAVFDELGIARGDVGTLLRAPTDALLAAQVAQSAGGGGVMGGANLGPVVGCPSLPVTPFDAVAAGSARGVPLIVGTNRDEMTLFLLTDPRMAGLDDDGLRQRLSATLGEAAPAIEDAYRQTRPGATPADLLVAILSDQMFRIPSIGLAEHHLAGGTADTYMYLFSYESARPGLRANHALEIRFVFDTLAGSHEEGAPGAQELSDRMRPAWAAFARTGSPCHDGIPTWPAYTTDRRATMWWDRDDRIVDDPFAAEREIWAAVGRPTG
jgi:para-nitrobenzyl esterase